MNFTHRVAVEADIPAIAALITRAIGALQEDFLTPAQVEASRAVMESDGRLAGCGGWSRRATLYGGDHSTALRDSALLNPARDAARIRAMYTDPDFVRRGVGRLVLSVCEAAAREAGFVRAEMMATLAGEPLYRACGYLPIERIETSGEVPVPMIRMGKDLG